MASEVFEGDYFDCAESNDYLKLLKYWRERERIKTSLV